MSSTTVSLPMRARHNWLLAIAAAAVVAAGAAILLVVDLGRNEKTTAPVAHKGAYVQAISSLTPRNWPPPSARGPIARAQAGLPG